MSLKHSSTFALVCVLALAAIVHPALADDTEIFTGSSSTGAVNPNIMFILDTSGSMSTPVTTQVAYDPTATYPGSCDATQTYFVPGTTGTPPTCVGPRFFPNTMLSCAAGASALGATAMAPGFYSDNLVQWRRAGRTSFSYAWNATLTGSTTTGFQVACQGDYPATGPFPSTYNGSTNSTANEFTTLRTSDYWSNGSPTLTTYTIYSGNYLNWYNFSTTTTIGTRISVVQQAASNLINSLSNVNIGLMRYSNDVSANGRLSADQAAQGGMVVYPVSPISTNRTSLVSALNSYDADGWTPLSETMYEAYLYFSGSAVHFGNSSIVSGAPFPSVPASRVGGVATSDTYQSPIQYSCQKNFIVFLTDGLPTQDNQADSLIASLPNEATLGGPCDDTTQPPFSNLPGGWGPAATAGKCLSALTKYMFNTDLSASLNGQQNLQTYFIGFGNDPGLAEAFGFLQAASSKGGGTAYTAGDLTSLQQVLTSIVTNILQTSSTFTAPTVAVNAFNRTQTLNDLYVSAFQPSSNYHWPGNIKRYLVSQGVIVDQNLVPAVDPATGSFKSSAQSFWSATPDGAQVSSGGAANQISQWDPSVTPSRNVYTYIGINPASPVDLTSSPNYAVTTANTNITLATLGVTSTMRHDNVINYARGEDLKDEHGNTLTTDTRHTMGDPLHAQSAVVIYGGTTSAPDITDGVVYAPTNDGYLHAFAISDGHELWSFIPQEQLGQLESLYSNAASSSKHYALDGSVRVLKYDVNGDGIIDPAAGDRVIIYFGTGRGGSDYYALDVTNEAAPKFMWTLSPTQLPGLGQAWSTPQLAKVNVGGGRQASAQKIVLIFAGGYDTAEETPSFTLQDTVGMSIFMVDSVTGTLLWDAGFTGSGADLVLSRMDHAIPSDVAVLDTNSDGFADRMYVGDLAGQLWRFDITTGNPRSTLVAGGVIASLGAHEEGAAAVATDTRRFYNTPDVSVVGQKGSPPFMNIAIGSGYRGHPLNITADDRFYSIRDFNPFTALSQSQYNALTVIHDVDLVDITNSLAPTVPAAAVGWKLLLEQPGTSWVGEKVLTSASTFNNQILFVTYTPNVSGTANTCQPSIGLNKFYAMSVLNGAPVANLNNLNNTSITDRSMSLAQTGIAPSLAFLFPAPTQQVDSNGNPIPTPTKSSVVCTSGGEVLGVCKRFSSRVKTYWNEADAP